MFTDPELHFSFLCFQCYCHGPKESVHTLGTNTLSSFSCRQLLILVPHMRLLYIWLVILSVVFLLCVGIRIPLPLGKSNMVCFFTQSQLSSSFFILPIAEIYPIPSPKKIFLESHQNSVQMWAALQPFCVGDIMRLFWFITSVLTFLEFFIFLFFIFICK